MKHYFGRIAERNGDFEYDTPYLFTTNGSPEKYADKIAREWRGCSKGDWDKALQGYWCDTTLVSDDGTREIPKADFDVLAKYLAVL